MIRLCYEFFTARRVCRACTMPWQDVCASVRLSDCLSVRLSNVGILSKRLYIYVFSPSVLKVNKRIEYKLLSLTCKVLTTAQPSYLHNLISLQPLRSTRSSSVVTLSRPPTICSLKITDRSFRYAPTRLWNKFPDSFCQPHHSCLDSPPHPLLNSSLSSSPLSPSITPSFFHSRLKTYLFYNFFSFTFYSFLFIPCGRLSWLPVNFLLHIEYTLSYRWLAPPS